MNNLPETLKPYHFHGVKLAYQEGATQVYADCPFCGKAGKMSIQVKTGKWRCYICSEGSENGGGNATTFLRSLHKTCSEANESQDYLMRDYESLRKSRTLLDTSSLTMWGAVKSILKGDWLVPGYNADRKISQLYRYFGKPKRKLMATSTIHHGLLLPSNFDPDKEELFVLESWNAIALWEVMGLVKRTEDGLEPTGSVASSLLANANVIGVPGCSTFSDKWASLFAGKRVYFLYDNDHPIKVNGKEVEPAALKGVKKAVTILSKAETPPESVHYLCWGDKGYDPELPKGYDVRDALSGETLKDRIPQLTRIFSLLTPIPDEWVAKGKTKGKGSVELDWTPCKSWIELINAWRKPMKWTEGLDRGLSVMLACIASTEQKGDQLWVKIISPPSSGKSVLCEALSVHKKYVLAKSTIRGFHSGFSTTNSNDEDNSLIALAKNKTLVTKDGDTLLQSPNVSQILAEARDIYDRVSRTHYRNKMSKDYEGIPMTWILCGTSSLRALDSSELGERFLDCVIVEDIDEDLEDEIGWRIINRVDHDLSAEDGDSSQESASMVEAKQKTGGYIDYLRKNMNELLRGVNFSDDAKRQCQLLAKFVSFMRARPSSKQEEKAEREMSMRLVSQHGRLAKCLAVVLQRKEVDKEVMRRVTRVATDTARGRTLDIVKTLYTAGEDGLELSRLAVLTNQTEDSERTLLRFMRKIGIVEVHAKKNARGIATRPRWKLADRMVRMYKLIKDLMAEDVS